MKKVFSALLSLVMLMSLLSVSVAVSATTPDTQVIEVAAGETVKIKFSEDNCYGVSGAIEYSNRSLFSSLTIGGSTSYGKITESAFILSSSEKGTLEVVLAVKIAKDAKVGDACVVSFTECELVENNEDFTGRSGYTKTVTVKVVKKETPGEPDAPTKPTASVDSTLDYSRLIEQINVAQALNQFDWTNDSRVELQSALDYAFDVLYNAATQKEVDDATALLAEAIANLVPIDGQALRNLIQEIRDWLEENDKEGLFVDLYAALVQAKDTLVSGDREAIQDAFNDLLDAFNALKLKWSDFFGENTKTVISPSADVDGQALHYLIQEILDWLVENDETGLFADLYAALVQAKDALTSGDRQAAYDAYEVLSDAFEALKRKWPELFDEELKDDLPTDATEPTSSAVITAPASKKEVEKVEAEIVKKGNDTLYILLAVAAAVAVGVFTAVVVWMRKRR